MLKIITLLLCTITIFIAGCTTESETEIISQDCDSLNDGESESRLRYQTAEVQQGESCLSQTQQRSCNDGLLSDWSGDYQYTSCQPFNSPLTLLDANAIEYQGGFRLSAAAFGDSEYPSLSYSPGVIAFNPANHSLFVVGHDYEQGIAEFIIPNIVNSRDINDFEVGEQVLQNFIPFHNTDRVDTGIDNYFRITGLALINQKLVVNYFNWYDAGGTETDTSVVFQNASDLANSEIIGPYQLQGAAHSSGWLTKIPEQWQSSLGGTYIAGHAGGSIISRLSVGPTAFVFSPEDKLLSRNTGAVTTQPLLNFSLTNMLYDKSIYGEEIESADAILYNDNRQNELWTISSNAAYGFIVPNTNTYMTVGHSKGHDSGLGYKITQDNGTICAGPCPYQADDHYNYYWLWRVSDLQKVQVGELQPYDLRPYLYGKLDSPSAATLKGGAYDASSGLLYVALKNGDTVGAYSRPPLFLVYKINVE